jgi:hypothetical protein
MANSLALYDSVASSNMRAPEKSALRRWFEANGPSILTKPPKPVHVRNTIAAVRHGSESLIMGALLGLAHAELPTGLDVFGIPADAVLGGLLTLGSAADSEYSSDARIMGGTAIGIYSFRTTTRLRTEMRLRKGVAVPKHLQYGSPTAKMAGEATEDPILRAGKALG